MSRFTRSITVLSATIYNTFPPANSNLGIKSNLQRSLSIHCIHLQSTPRNSNHRPTLLCFRTRNHSYTPGVEALSNIRHIYRTRFFLFPTPHSPLFRSFTKRQRKHRNAPLHRYILPTVYLYGRGHRIRLHTFCETRHLGG